MSTNYKFFDPSTVNDLARFQGTFAGVQAGNARVCGPAMAPTSIYNQAGWYATEDANTGYVSLQKLSNDSLYTKQWYDQGTGLIFDFTDGGKGVTATKAPTTQNNNQSFLDDYVYGNGYVVNENESANSSDSNSNSTTSSNNQGSNTQGTQGAQQNAQQNIQGSQSTGNAQGTQENNTYGENTTEGTQESNKTITADEDDTISLTAKDLEEMVEAGIYKNNAEALAVTLNSGYNVSDEEQAKLDIYTDKDEKKIALMMEKYGITRSDAIASLNLDAEAAQQITELEKLYEDVQDEQGFLGKAWNGIKNFFNAGLSSEDVEYTIEQFKNGEVSYDEAKSVIESYQKKQNSASKNIGTAAAVAVGFTPLGLAGSLVLGGVTKAGIGILDRASNNVEGDAISGEVLTDAVVGATSAGVGKVAKFGGKAIGGLFGKIGKGITGLASKLFH